MFYANSWTLLVITLKLFIYVESDITFNKNTEHSYCHKEDLKENGSENCFTVKKRYATEK